VCGGKLGEAVLDADCRRLDARDQAGLLKWLLAQETWRRAAVHGAEVPEALHHWAGDTHEIDFVIDPETFVEAKRGAASPVEFAWFPRAFPRGHLTVVNAARFETDRIRGVTLEDWLLGA
jgi:hypothetical protein